MKRFLLVVIFLWSGVCFSQEDYTDVAALSDGPASHHVLPLLEAVNSAEVAKLEAFIAASFTPEFLQQFPMAMHLEFLQEAHAFNGKLSFGFERKYHNPGTPNELVVLVQSEKTDLWSALAIYYSPEKPHKISGLDMWDVSLPEENTLITTTEAVNKLDMYVKRMAKRGVFSGSVLVGKGDKVLYSHAEGMASKRFNVPNNVQTKFNLGSMNKMFTAIAIMQLVEAGKLSLSDKLSQYADESWLPKAMSRKIEIRHLLTHSSGLGSYFNQAYMETSKNRFRALQDYKPLIVGEKLQFEPGSDNAYSNTGMFMLGVVIESVTGQDYFSYIRDHIYKPAGMVSSGSFEMDQPVPNLAVGYTASAQNDTGWVNNLYTHVLKGGPAGGGFSTVEDLHRFAQALVNFKLLGKKFTEELYLPRPSLHSPEYGYGFSVDGTPDNRIVGHNGGFLGISSNLDIYLDQGYASVVLSNYSNGSWAVQRKVRQLLARIK